MYLYICVYIYIYIYTCINDNVAQALGAGLSLEKKRACKYNCGCVPRRES